MSSRLDTQTCRDRERDREQERERMQEKEKNICIERVVSCAPVLLCCGGDVRDLVTQPAWKRFGTCDGRIELAKKET